MSVDELIKAADQLNETELDCLLQQVVKLRTQRKANVLSAEEAQFLDSINRSISAALQTQYQNLRAKREAETLTHKEHSQLIELSKQIEQLSAERLKALAALAQLRRVSLSELIEQLGISPVSYV